MKDDDKTKQNIGQLKLEVPVQVLFEGLDLGTYYKTTEISTIVKDTGVGGLYKGYVATLMKQSSN